MWYVSDASTHDGKTSPVVKHITFFAKGELPFVYFANELKKHSQFINLSLLDKTSDNKKICSYIIAAAFNDDATDFIHNL